MTKISFRRSLFVLALASAVPALCAVPAHAAAKPAHTDFAGIPGSCRQIHDSHRHARDGKYILFSNGNLFTVYCYDMMGTPREYIDLAATGPDANFSQYTAGGASPGKNVRTTFTRLRIDPATLSVDIGDLTFASSTGSLRHGSTTVTSMPYGVAMSCTSPQSANGVGNIDLEGTPFQVDSTFVSGGFQAAGSAAVSPDQQMVALKGGGYCGWITPAPALFNPFNPSPGEFHLQLSCTEDFFSLETGQFCLRVG